MFSLTDEEKQFLLDLARNTLEAHLRSEPKPEIVPETQLLQENFGAFVTVKNGGDLRGCIGLIAASKPLYQTVAEMAVGAGTGDPRFPSVTLEELPDIDFEISVLTPFEVNQDAETIEVGKHGLLIKKGFSQGLLLPQVAVEYGWDREQFLQHTCIKAGLPPRAWKDPKVEIQTFSAVIFGEDRQAE